MAEHQQQSPTWVGSLGTHTTTFSYSIVTSPLRTYGAPGHLVWCRQCHLAQPYYRERRQSDHTEPGYWPGQEQEHWHCSICEGDVCRQFGREH